MMDDTYANQDVTMNAETVASTFAEGTPVFDVDGDKVGSVAENATRGGYFVARKGLIFTHDLYIPLNAVARSDMDGVYLNVGKSQIERLGWDQPPGAATDVTAREEELTVNKERARGEGITGGDIPTDQQGTVTGFGPGAGDPDDEMRPRDTRLA